MTKPHSPGLTLPVLHGARSLSGIALTRRQVLGGATAGLAWVMAGTGHAQTPAQTPAPLRFEDLIDRAQFNARRPYEPPVVPSFRLIRRLDYDAHWQIRFREDQSLFPGVADAPVQLFYPGRYFPEPVEIHLRDGAGQVAEVPFNNALFTIPEHSPAHDLPPGFGFAGFRVMRPGQAPDWVSFLGASYFRADGPDRQYGLSARGVAINTGLTEPEEFPRFTAFWLGPPEAEGDDLSVWALLDGPSITGAYTFGMRRAPVEGAGHVTRVKAHLFMRRDVDRLGIAPLTSMYWYSERDRIIGKDWRPEIHDSDGLALATGSGERIWRPLNNSTTVSTASFFDDNPQGFGLIQRDRNFADYQDDGVFYNRRPSAWVRPRGPWGRGAVQLIEIPTENETFDNIVAYWVPEAPARRGDAFVFEYDIEWRATDPRQGPAAIVIATRQGQGGRPGEMAPPGVSKMVVDFQGPALDGLDNTSGVRPVVSAVNGDILDPVRVYKVVGADYWRLVFDFRQTTPGPAILRAYLERHGQALSETWVSDAWANMRG